MSWNLVYYILHLYPCWKEDTYIKSHYHRNYDENFASGTLNKERKDIFFLLNIQMVSNLELFEQWLWIEIREDVYKMHNSKFWWWKKKKNSINNRGAHIDLMLNYVNEMTLNCCYATYEKCILKLKKHICHDTCIIMYTASKEYK